MLPQAGGKAAGSYLGCEQFSAGGAVSVKQHFIFLPQAAGEALSTARENLTYTVVTRQKQTLVIHGPIAGSGIRSTTAAFLVSLIAPNLFVFVTGAYCFGCSSGERGSGLFTWRGEKALSVSAFRWEIMQPLPVQSLATKPN